MDMKDGEKILQKFIQGFTFEEVSDNIDNLDQLTIVPPHSSHTPVYGECGGDIIKFNNDIITCSKCGITEYDFINEWVDNIWMYKKSVHSKKRWFYNKVKLVIESRYANMLTSDFIEVTRVIKLKGKNISNYNYYIIRLASRRGMKLTKPVNDMKNSKTKVMFDDRLFGEVYRDLGWDNKCRCPYYLEWLNRHELRE